jgi:hypothetical protein
MAFKPQLTLEQLSNPESYNKYNKDTYFKLVVYFLFVVLLQFGINTSIIINKCGGSASKNIGVAAFLTFIPWILFFGIIIIVLIVFPGFKNVFSDVVGYFFVSGSANKILNDLLIDTNVENAINNVENSISETSTVPTITNQNDDLNIPQKSTALSLTQEPNLTSKETSSVIKGGNASTKKDYQNVADVILKLCGNKSILINQMVPSNFLQYWSLLKPLMKEKYQNEETETLDLKQKLLNIVVSRDNVGEGFWYGYTAVVLISIIQYYITSRGCVQDMKTMNQNYQKYLAEEESTQQQQAKSQTVYTLGTPSIPSNS